MIAYSICRPTTEYTETIRIGFSVWARSIPKDYLSVYPKVFREIRGNVNFPDAALLALVDDVWPRITLSRTLEEQKNVSNRYTRTLPKLGFNQVHLVSEFCDTNALGHCMSLGKKVNLSEFWKLMPQSKKSEINQLTMAEIIGFLWHVYVVKTAIDRYSLTGIIAGVRSEFFYLTTRKLLPPHDLYFVDTS